MIPSKGYAAFSPTTPLAPLSFERRDVGATDIQIQILFCGVCHSDLHTARNEWAHTQYPVVPGHEIVGKVTSVGKNVTTFKVGDLAAVGCMVDSCRKCDECKAGFENFCDGKIFTYGSPEVQTGKPTYGGYSDQIIVEQRFVLRVSNKLDLAGTAPLLCAGITTYSPLKHWNAGRGKRVGVVGLGGLGHMGVKIANAMGAEVAVFTTSASKTADAKRLGAHEVVVTRDPAEVKKHAGRFDFILNTVSVPHDLDIYVEALKRDGAMCLVGVPPTPHPSPNVGNLIFKRRSICGSLIGGIPETQEMLDFCAAHNLVSDVEVIPMQKINEAYDRLVKSDVKYRFVIDMASIRG